MVKTDMNSLFFLSKIGFSYIGLATLNFLCVLEKPRTYGSSLAPTSQKLKLQ